MPLRPLAASILIFIFIMVGVFEIYVKIKGNHSVYHLSPGHKWVGVIDMNYDHGIDMGHVIKGNDVLLVADVNNPLFQQIIQFLFQQKSSMTLENFVIADFDSNDDGVLNAEDPIFQHLHVLVFNPDGQGYEVKSLSRAGIRGIKIKTISPGRHEVILSDGSTRILYEINRPGGTVIHKTTKRKHITTLPEIPNR